MHHQSGAAHAAHIVVALVTSLDDLMNCHWKLAHIAGMFAMWGLVCAELMTVQAQLVHLQDDLLCHHTSLVSFLCACLHVLQTL